MAALIPGGTTNYGQIVGILMTDSVIPRIPGDPGHAETFDYPVRYGVIRDFPFSDLVDIKRDNLDKVIHTALELQREGVSFIAADCGLFSPFQHDVSQALDIPFLGSSLSLIPFLEPFIPAHKKIGVLTGDANILKEEHLRAAGANPLKLIIRGLEACEEFQRVVINRDPHLDPIAMRQGALDAARDLVENGEPLAAIVLECTNLISFKYDIQIKFNLPVYDMVSMVDFFASGYRLRKFDARFISPA